MLHEKVNHLVHLDDAKVGLISVMCDHGSIVEVTVKNEKVHRQRGQQLPQKSMLQFWLALTKSRVTLGARIEILRFSIGSSSALSSTSPVTLLRVIMCTNCLRSPSTSLTLSSTWTSSTTGAGETRLPQRQTSTGLHEVKRRTGEIPRDSGDFQGLRCALGACQSSTARHVNQSGLGRCVTSEKGISSVGSSDGTIARQAFPYSSYPSSGGYCHECASSSDDGTTVNHATTGAYPCSLDFSGCAGAVSCHELQTTVRTQLEHTQVRLDCDSYLCESTDSVCVSRLL